MAAARPIVVGANPAQGAIPLTDCVDGVFVEPGSVTGLLDTIAALKADPGRARSLADAAGAFALERMDYPRIARAYLDILERAVAYGRSA